MTIRSMFAPRVTAHAHCDLPCGIYDPEQARIEAESCLKIQQKLEDNQDPAFRTRAIAIKEERAELVKHHLDVLWHDYFKPEHLSALPDLHQTFWAAAKQASTVKASSDPAEGEKLLAMIDDIDRAWQETGGTAEDAGQRPPRGRACGCRRPLTRTWRHGGRGMPAWSSPKRDRQYEHIKDSYEDRGVSKDEAEERAARTVNKERREHGETKTEVQVVRCRLSPRAGGIVTLGRRSGDPRRSPPSRRRVRARSVERRMADGWIVTSTSGARSESNGRP